MIERESRQQMWGTMASGIMFRFNGHILLQLRSGNVMDGGVWGVPGGALSGTEGHYDTEDLEKPELTPQLMLRLWKSALKEVEEELGYVPKIDKTQVKPVVNWIGGTYPYVTFVVDINEQQAQEINENMSGNWESEGHEWTHPDDQEKELHPGVRYVLDELGASMDIRKVVLASELPQGMECQAKDRWTQHQVYDDGKCVYDVAIIERLVKANRVEKIKIKDLVDQLYDKSVWAEGDRELSPIMVLTNPTFDHTTIKHMSRIRTSDLDRPIIIRFKTGRVIDGYHRLAKAFMSGQSSIKSLYAQEEQLRKAIFRD